jgi:hypothetical protein
LTGLNAISAGREQMRSVSVNRIHTPEAFASDTFRPDEIGKIPYFRGLYDWHNDCGKYPCSRRIIMYKLRKPEILLLTIALVFFVAGLTNASVPPAKYKKIADQLSMQMTRDFPDNKLSVEIIRAENMELAGEKEAFFGDAYLIIENTDERPHIYFEAIVDTLNNEVSMVDYTFLDNEAGINRNFLEKLVIKKLGNDFGTREVVFAADDIYRVEENGGTEKFRGVGEARIGAFVWKKVRFEITLQGDSKYVLYKTEDF